VTPALGAFSANALVQAYASDGTLLATARTDDNGRVSTLAIPVSHTGLVILRVTGGDSVKYFDEGSGRWLDFAANQSIYSVIPAAAVQPGAAFGVTPLTNLLAGLVGVDTTTPSAPRVPSGQANDAAVNTAKQQVALMTGLPIDVLAAPDPLKDLSTPKNGSTVAGLYGVLLAEMARQASLQGQTALEQAQSLKQDAANAANLTPLIQSVREATDQLQGHALLDTAGGAAELDKLLAASAVAKAPGVVLDKTADLSVLQSDQEQQRTAKVNVLTSTPDIQGIWDTVGGTAVITADRQLVLRLSPQGGATRLVVAKLVVDAPGVYKATGQELLMQNDDVTFSPVTVTVSRINNTSPMTLAVLKNEPPETWTLIDGSRYERKVTLADFAGHWTDQIGNDYQVGWDIVNGIISGETSSRCTWLGRVSTRGEAKAVADVAVTESCNGSVKTLRGIAVFKDGSEKKVLRLSLINKPTGSDLASSALLLDMYKSQK